jgi:hypothetical protein
MEQRRGAHASSQPRRCCVDAAGIEPASRAVATSHLTPKFRSRRTSARSRTGHPSFGGTRVLSVTGSVVRSPSRRIQPRRAELVQVTICEPDPRVERGLPRRLIYSQLGDPSPTSGVRSRGLCPHQRLTRELDASSLWQYRLS